MELQSNPIWFIFSLILSIPIWVLIIYIALNLKRIVRKISGTKIERFVTSLLSDLDPIIYSVLENISLASNGNTTITQIDHIVVSNYGIFCIETKSNIGWIFGSEHQKYWTQVIYKNRYKFYNPIWQNYAHVKALESLLGEKLKRPIIQCIAFPAASKLKINSKIFVGSGKSTVENIKKYSDIIYSDTERNEIISLIEASNIIDPEAQKQHAKEVNALQENRY